MVFNKNKNIFSVISFFIIFTSLFSIGFSDDPVETENGCNQYIVSSEGNSFLKMSVISPFGDVLTSVKKGFDTYRNADESNLKIQIPYHDFSENFNCGTKKQVYCTVGGKYSTVTELGISELVPDNKCENNECSKKIIRDLYYCPTTVDLYNKVKIPTSWLSDDLIVYCNDGSEAGYSQLDDINFEIFSNTINSYKACIIKNENLDDDNTIIYGLEYGLATVLTTVINKNPNVLPESSEIFDVVSMDGNLVQGLTLINNLPKIGNFYKGIFKDTLNREYIVEYNNDTFEFMIYKSSLNLDFSLTNYYNLENVTNKHTTRTIFVKKNKNKKIIVGFDFAAVEKNIVSRLPIYYIQNPDFNQKDICVTHLGKYGALIPTTVVNSDSKIGCLDNGMIEINTKGFTDEKDAFNIYKNIIFDYE